MPRQIIKDNIWRARINDANRYYESWEKLFKCRLLDDYYEGIQWRSQRQLGYNPYVINKVYETIQIKLADFIPTFPKYLVSTRPSNEEDNLEAAAFSANIKQDTLNTLIQNEASHFSEEIELAYKDHFTRFSIIEVGYSADWIINPRADKPLLDSNVDSGSSGKNRYKVKREPDELP